MWERHEWVRLADGLAQGSRRRVRCNCGEGKTLLLSRDDEGLRAHCFREGLSDRALPPPESLADKLARIQRRLSADLALSARPAIPTGGVRDVDEWPKEAALWFHKAGLGRHDIGRLGAQYLPDSNRVLLPVMNSLSHTVDFWQARSLDGRQPKYLAPLSDRSRVISRWGHADSVTLVEDILSAYKVGLVSEGWSMLGTKLSDHVLGELMARHSKQPDFTVNVWFDNDLPPKHTVNRGQIAAMKALAKLRAVGIPARNVISTQDPKLTSRVEIKELLHVL